MRNLRRTARLEHGLVLDEGVVVVRAMSRRRMHESRSGVVRHIIGGQHRHGEIPVAVRTLDAPEGMRRARDHDRQHILHAFVGGDAGGCEHLRGELVGKHVTIADLCPVVVGRSGDFVEAIRDVLAISDGAVRRDRPRSRRPDHHRRAFEIAVDRLGDRKLHPDRARCLLVILDLGFGQRGLLDRRPHHRLRAAIELVADSETHELAGDLRFGIERHRGVGVVPVTLDRETLELLALHVDPFLGESPAFAAELDDRNVVLVLALRAIFLLDLPFDRQAVAIPARHIIRVEAEHPLRADNEVLQDLVEGVADMDVAIGIGRAIVQHETRTAFLHLAQALVEFGLLPALEEQRLTLRQSRAHGKLGLGKKKRLGIIASGGLCLVGHGGQ